MVDHSVNEHDAPFIIRIMELEEKCDALRARVAELEAACAAMAEALKPLAALTIWSDNQVSTGIAPCHVEAARALLAMQTAREAPGEATSE